MDEQADRLTDGLTGGTADELLLAAIHAYDVDRARELVEGGADPDRSLPDGTTPLSLAVASGSPGLVDAVLGKEPRLRLPARERERLLALARRWYDTGAETEVRRLTGAPGDAEVVRIVDEPYIDWDWQDPDIERITLGGRTVRAGHGAVLTKLEWAFRVLTPPGELIGRAARTDARHVDFWESIWVLMERGSDRTWQSVLAHRSHPDSGHRLFVAEHLRCLGVTMALEGIRQREADRVLVGWTAQEADSEVLAGVLNALATADDGAGAVVLPHAGHPDARVRRAAADCLLRWPSAPSSAALAALTALAGDDDPGVREAAATAAGRRRHPQTRRILLELLDDTVHTVRLSAANALAGSRDPHPSVAAALWGLLDEDDQELRLEGAHGLSLLDDPRTPEARDRVGPLRPEFLEDVRTYGLRAWWGERRRGVGTGQQL